MTDHYSRMSSKEIDALLEGALKRVAAHTDFSEEVLADVVKDMTEEGYRKHEILAHVNIIDIEYRT